MLVQEDLGQEEGTENCTESNLDCREEFGARVQVLLGSDIVLGEIQTVIVIAIGEVVDVVSDHTVLAIVNCTVC